VAPAGENQHFLYKYAELLGHPAHRLVLPRAGRAPPWHPRAFAAAIVVTVQLSFGCTSRARAIAPASARTKCCVRSSIASTHSTPRGFGLFVFLQLGCPPVGNGALAPGSASRCCVANIRSGAGREPAIVVLGALALYTGLRAVALGVGSPHRGSRPSWWWLGVQCIGSFSRRVCPAL
jgi:hypothetical protein